MKTTALIFAFTTTLGLSSTAWSQSYIRQPQDHGKVEVEVHGVLGFGAYRAAGFGAGLRIGIPVAPRGPIRTINNSMTINFGADFVWWPFEFYTCNGIGCYYVGYPTLIAPVVLQWNFYLSNRWSIAGELGFAPEFSFFDRNSVVFAGDCRYWAFCPWPVIAFTARFHFRDNNQYPALTMRLGFPVGFNIGVSF